MFNAHFALEDGRRLLQRDLAFENGRLVRVLNFAFEDGGAALGFHSEAHACRAQAPHQFHEGVVVEQRLAAYDDPVADAVHPEEHEGGAGHEHVKVFVHANGLSAAPAALLLPGGEVKELHGGGAQGLGFVFAVAHAGQAKAFVG